LKRPTRFTLAVRPWIVWIPLVLAAGLIASWLVFAAARAGDPLLLSSAAIASTIVGLLVAGNRLDDARWVFAGLGAAALLPFKPRSRNVFGAFVVIGIPWLTFLVVS